MLFEQFFALEESIEELKAQMHQSEGSEGSCFSSLNSSTCSLASVREANVCSQDQTLEEEDEDVFEPLSREDSAGVFVRQRVSYPPISRNRCRRSQTVSAGQQQKGEDEDEGVAGLEGRVVLRRLFSLPSYHAELKSDGGESSVSSLDSGVCLPAFPAALQAMLDRAAAGRGQNPDAEAEIFV
ncbi:Hypothetical predicted protein [Cloeon dipterum]|uniref:Uncharacterized protein n=1 Tax=Cloeon dipterum TaxID=197152 RepID=A0A8S1DPC3_9INSE|nr:Hypothetical predicted protein [Cloeon dipterum]